MSPPLTSFPSPTGAFVNRHIGLDDIEKAAMLEQLELDSISDLISKTVPASIRRNTPLELSNALDENEALSALDAIAKTNIVARNFIGMGYYGTHTPKVILRNILENPGWYTAYTPYQAEISQGRLEMLLNYQQMVCDLTGMEMANASLLDEGTAAAEAMAMAHRQQRNNKSNRFFIDQDCHPQTLAVVETRARHFGFEIAVGDASLELPECFGALFQYPGSSGNIPDLSAQIEKAHSRNALAIVASDLLALSLLVPPGEMGADIVLGSSQRFGVPMGFGGPHAAFFAFRESYKRLAPGRIIGVSLDARGNQALRMAMQTREQHIRREKATSNICTSQVLLAVIAAAYAVYHGPEGIKRIALRVHALTNELASGLLQIGFAPDNESWFDTLTLKTGKQTSAILDKARKSEINIRLFPDKTESEQCVGISLDETSTEQDVIDLLRIFGESDLDKAVKVSGISFDMLRTSDFLTHPVFNTHHSETEMLRYLHRLESKDLALNQSMIPLGSCTMKLNATSEMIPVTWPEFGQIHPFAPLDQAQGYVKLFAQLEQMLAECTGYDAVSLQPNAGSQGEYAGLLAIKGYHESRGDLDRNICLIPESAHGTNPASACMVGMKVVVVRCDENGNVDLADLKAKAEKYAENLAALMVTYPSTHGVFEEAILEICDVIHQYGGQVYTDGANLNALVGLADPGQFGSDVSHLNLHKTFCIPHGGGGPGMGPIGVRKHLQAYLPTHPINPHKDTDQNENRPVVSAAQWGSASILPISWMYVKMMGSEGMRHASEIAILNANYVANQLENDYPVLYRGTAGYVAHECIIDIRPIKNATGIGEEDIAKRLMDYGFHAPTMSFPVAGTLMIEPTESESKTELDRFCEAMISIRAEISEVERGEVLAAESALRNAPHTLEDILDVSWPHSYSREKAARPGAWQRQHKYWPAVNRIDNVHGDRNLMCTCPAVEDYS